MANSSLPRRTAAATAAAATAALVLTGCGGSSSADTADSGRTDAPLPTVEVDPELAARVPESVAEDGIITVGSDTAYAPAEFILEDGTTVVGFDVDLFDLVAQKLGLEQQFVTAPFDSIIAGVSSGKYEVAVSALTIKPERVEQANMVSYFSAGTQWAVRSGNSEDVDPDNACGKRVAVVKASHQIDDIEARSRACVDAGQPEVVISQYEAQNEATAAVASGKDDATLADSPVIAYAVEQTDGQLELLGDVYESAPYGYVVPKDQAEFAQVLADAVQSLIDEGAYLEVLERWGVEGGAITDPAVNPSVG